MGRIITLSLASLLLLTSCSLDLLRAKEMRGMSHCERKMTRLLKRNDRKIAKLLLKCPDLKDTASFTVNFVAPVGISDSAADRAATKIIQIIQDTCLNKGADPEQLQTSVPELKKKLQTIIKKIPCNVEIQADSVLVKDKYATVKAWVKDNKLYGKVSYKKVEAKRIIPNNCKDEVKWKEYIFMLVIGFFLGFLIRQVK